MIALLLILYVLCLLNAKDNRYARTVVCLPFVAVACWFPVMGVIFGAFALFGGLHDLSTNEAFALPLILFVFLALTIWLSWCLAADRQGMRRS